MVTGHGTLRRRSARHLATAALAAGMLSAFGAAGVGHGRGRRGDPVARAPQPAPCGSAGPARPATPAP